MNVGRESFIRSVVICHIRTLDSSPQIVRKSTFHDNPAFGSPSGTNQKDREHRMPFYNPKLDPSGLNAHSNLFLNEMKVGKENLKREDLSPERQIQG